MSFLVRSRPSVIGSKAGMDTCLGGLSFRRAALIGILFTLMGCGFQPLHGQGYREQQNVDLPALMIEVVGNTVNSGASNTSTRSVPRRYSELLKAEIEDQINPDGQRGEKLFRLAINYNELEVALFVNPDGTASRGDLIYTSTYNITRLSDGKPVANGSIQRNSSYNTSPTADYASYVSIEDARKRGITTLAQDYKLRLAALLPTLNNPTAAPAPAIPVEPAPPLQPVRSYETLRSGY